MKNDNIGDLSCWFKSTLLLVCLKSKPTLQSMTRRPPQDFFCLIIDFQIDNLTVFYKIRWQKTNKINAQFLLSIMESGTPKIIVSKHINEGLKKC